MPEGDVRCHGALTTPSIRLPQQPSLRERKHLLPRKTQRIGPTGKDGTRAVPTHSPMSLWRPDAQDHLNDRHEMRYYTGKRALCSQQRAKGIPSRRTPADTELKNCRISVTIHWKCSAKESIAHRPISQAVSGRWLAGAHRCYCGGSPPFLRKTWHSVTFRYSFPPDSQEQGLWQAVRAILAWTSPGFGVRVDVCDSLKNGPPGIALHGASHAGGVIAPSELREGRSGSLIPARRALL